MAKDMMNLFARREQDELAAAAATSSPILRDVHLHQARHYRRLAQNVQEAIDSAPPTRLSAEGAGNRVTNSIPRI